MIYMFLFFFLSSYACSFLSAVIKILVDVLLKSMTSAGLNPSAGGLDSF